ncbi:PTS lactose/cellobiose transporter subunit IIA [Geobacillus stearothermophilus]|nr:PTS lactose/cellobiose transporter subunit IIA [Geobacillus stearothermophilus]MED3741976.1 PTS lactose/cellobiose transporter subunit IIA [Geobacillus stearothermophilus]MED3754775.1 PTS lactose/cellobiose transporter subunit IIA [Geobacillus stearothermophilus]MED3766465.1 PTS lactose/cellobiose transporter subunit IIA [Geobacillus stearothermophilus]
MAVWLHKAIAAAKQGKLSEARRLLEQAGAERQAAHELQTSLRQPEGSLRL